MWLILLLIPIFLAGCGTYGRQYDIEVDVRDNNGIVVLSPDISGKSGNSPVTSANTTDLQELLKLDPADLIKQLTDLGISQDAINEVLDKIKGAQEEKDPPKPDPAEPIEPDTPEPTVPTEPTEPTDPETFAQSQVCDYFEITNGNRPTWYCYKPMASYGKRIRVVVAGHLDATFDNDGTRWEGNGWVVKESEVAGRGLAIVGPNTTSDGAKATVHFN